MYKVEGIGHESFRVLPEDPSLFTAATIVCKADDACDYGNNGIMGLGLVRLLLDIKKKEHDLKIDKAPDQEIEKLKNRFKNMSGIVFTTFGHNQGSKIIEIINREK